MFSGVLKNACLVTSWLLNVQTRSLQGILVFFSFIGVVNWLTRPVPLKAIWFCNHPLPFLADTLELKMTDDRLLSGKIFGEVVRTTH